MVRSERAALVEDLTGIDVAAWQAPSLCAGWNVEDVVAHLTAGASLGRWAWLRSIVGARFDADLHNARRMADHRGGDPQDTLRRLAAVVGSRVAPSADTAAWLGEVVVHGRDVRVPLGIARTPAAPVVTEVASRRGALDDLAGPGVAVFRERMPVR